MRDEHGRSTYGVGGGSYGLIGIGIGLSASHLGASIFISILSGLFWPATLGYWLLQALHTWAT